jgi:hypothetical protein
VDFACLRRSGFAQAGNSDCACLPVGRDCGFKIPKSEIQNRKLRYSLSKNKKAMDYSSIAFLFSIFLPARRQTKKAMGARKPPMAFVFNSK